jgi:hypothetical protein
MPAAQAVETVSTFPGLPKYFAIALEAACGGLCATV